jgi:hypothetical protein
MGNLTPQQISSIRRAVKFTRENPPSPAPDIPLHHLSPAQIRCDFAYHLPYHQVGKFIYQTFPSSLMNELQQRISHHYTASIQAIDQLQDGVSLEFLRTVQFRAKHLQAVKKYCRIKAINLD